jgi:methionyl-tRNA formyltransferase
MRLAMMGTGTFAEPTFEALLASSHQVVGLVTQPDRATGEKRGSTRQVGKGMKEIAIERGVPVYQPESVNTPEGVAQLTAWQPELLVVAAYGQILSKDVLATAKLGGINVHASLLPKYRGAAPIAWAIYHGEKETGVTIIRMSTALDAGDMVAQESIPIGADETAGELEARLAPLGARLALDVINRLAAGPVSGISQDKSRATKAPKLTKEHGLIDWSRAAAAVCNQIRAMHPWPTAYTFLHRARQTPTRVIVHRALFSHAVRDSSQPTPGQTADSGAVIVVGTKHIIVLAGDGHGVIVQELQPAGKKRMDASEFLRGHNLDGARLGPESLASDAASAKR